MRRRMIEVLLVLCAEGAKVWTFFGSANAETTCVLHRECVFPEYLQFYFLCFITVNYGIDSM